MSLRRKDDVESSEPLLRRKEQEICLMQDFWRLFSETFSSDF